jgi:hypothetical protein
LSAKLLPTFADRGLSHGQCGESPTAVGRKKNTEALIGASKDVDLDINVEKTQYMLLSRHQNAGQYREVKTTDRPFENVSQFKYLGTTVTNENLIQEEIKSRLNSVQSRKLILFAKYN